jgi:predicted HNH restriction endonuclease
MWYTTPYMPRADKRSYSDRAEYLKKAVAERRRKLRDMAIEYGGGKCTRCGYAKSKRALSFHHKDPSKKDFGLSARGLTRSWEKMKVELDKCVLVCANCHMEIHEKLERNRK